MKSEENATAPKGAKRNRRRANGEGWINRRSDGKGYDVGLHVEHADGTVERRATTRKKRSDAAAWLHEQTSLRTDGIILGRENPTISEYADIWLEDSVRGASSIRTYKFYKSVVKCHIKPGIGGVKIKDLTPRRIQYLYATERDAGLSVATRRHTHTTLKKMLSEATQFKDIPSNPAAYVKPPKATVVVASAGASAGGQERGGNFKPFTEDELRRIVAATVDNRMCAIYTFAPVSGLRQQELLALTWSDLDLPLHGRGRVKVDKALVEVEHGFAVGPTKNRRSRRSVGFPENVVAVMRRHRKLQSEEKLKSKRWEEHGLVFPNTVGTHLNRHRLYRYFAKARESSGVDKRHQFRDFRHTFATLMFDRGAHPKVVQEMMGHSSIKITMDTYSHYIPGMDDGAGEMLGDVF